MFELKFFAAAFIFLNVALGDTSRDEIMEYWIKKTEPYLDGCLLDSHLDVKDLNNAHESYSFPETQAISCYMKCIYQKLGVMDSNGNMNAQVLVDKEAPFITEENLEKCSSKLSSISDHCEKAFAFADCLAKIYLN